MAFESCKPFVVDCVVNKNALAPKSNVGWLEGQALDTDNKEAMNIITKHFITVEETPSEDDFTFLKINSI